ncbi:MAG TPA: Tex-like N-terminal domain-containing protein, partial [Planctomycetota bacterium]|nr:Tex-like N-terminal domain-containing protein [Planctomycetota bacterium]
MASQAILDRLCAEFDSPAEAIAAATALLEDRAPPAFIARYRRLATRNMAEDRLLALADRLHFLSELEARKQAIAQQAEERGRMTEQLRAVLETSADQDLLDDLYQSMRPRRRTPAMQMEEKGLLPLALAIQHRQLGELTLQDAAREYIAEDKGLPSIEAVLEGVVLILAEKIATDAFTRARFREELARGLLKARAVNPDQGSAQRYKDFFDFAEPIGRIGTGRMLALRRAEREGILQLQLALPENRHREILRELHQQGLPEDSPLREFWDLVFDHVYTQHLQESCGRDVRRRIKEKADREAVRTYARNLRSQLLSPPLGAKKVLALRTSSKSVWAALLGEDGSVNQHKTLPLDTDEQKTGAMEWLCQLIREAQPAAIALPHGRRQAGSERIVEALRQALGETPLPMVIPVDEAASAIFATSPVGRKALPGVEVGVRTAVSLGRRLQDPLRELVRMDFRTLGLGHIDDVHQGMLQRELHAVVSSCLAAIGTDLNRADQDALGHVPGVDHDVAKAILDHRRQHGGFKNRAELKQVTGVDERAFRHLCGFVQIEGGDEPLDRTTVHPEDYELARGIALSRSTSIDQLFGTDLRDVDLDRFTTGGVDRMQVLNVLQSLRAAGKDPRGEMTATANAGVRTIDDLRADQELRGRVANLTEFGAFLDLGIGQDGLVHISQIPANRLRNPEQMLRVGEVVT